VFAAQVDALKEACTGHPGRRVRVNYRSGDWNGSLRGEEPMVRVGALPADSRT
jgi:hypothetical protein